jgi:hypothetical protein
MKPRASLTGFALIASLIGASAAEPSLHDISAALRRAHFSYPMDRSEVTLRGIGEIHASRHNYVIVFYLRAESERSMRARHGGTAHGSQRLLVFERTARSLRYLGQYSVDVVPVAIQENEVIFGSPPANGNEIVFGADGPPRTAWIDGENPAFDTQP